MTAASAQQALEGLTGRQLQALQCAARGMCTKLTARHLGLSSRTVEGHRAKLVRKLGVNLQGACALAGLAGIV